jgi:plastocyanin
MRRVGFIAIVAVLVATGCGSSTKETTTATTTGTAATGAQQFTVNLDGKTDAFNGEFGSFFPNTLSAHPGDTVKFALPRFSGVPHTVTFGTLVDSAVAKLDQLGPTALPDAQENAPEMLNLPDVFPHKNAQGQPDANQSAGQPCYMDSGVPPLSLTGSAPACPKVAQPDFTGTQSFYNMGLLAKDGDSVSMKLAPTIKPGTYSFICLIHRGVMTAKLTVAPAASSVPSPADVTAAGTQQFNQQVTGVTPAAKAAQQTTPDKAALGTGDPKYPSAVVAEFGPKSISIPVGGSVTWNEFAFHTLAFGATDADVGALSKAPDGSVHLGKGGAPVGFTVPPNLFEFPPPPNGKPVLVDLGNYDGTGYHNTGITGSVPPQFVAFKVTFTKAGTYTVRCLVHPDMKGEIKVG